MGGRVAAEPEVGRRGDDPPTEVVLPDPVDHDAGCQGIVSLTQPSRQLEPTTRLSLHCPGWRGSQQSKPRNAAGDECPRTVGITAPLQRRIGRLALVDRVTAWQIGRKRSPLQSSQLGPHLGQPAPRLRVFVGLERLDGLGELFLSLFKSLELGFGARRIDQGDEIHPGERFRVQFL